MGKWSSWSEDCVRLTVAEAVGEGRDVLEALEARHRREWAER